MRSKMVTTLAAAVLAAALAGCGAGGGAGDSGDGPIKIGFFAPKTGFGAPDGRSALAGAKLAVKLANADGGVDGRDLELVEYDDGSDPKQGAVIATKLTTQDKVVAAVSGSYSPQTLAAAAIFQRAQVPMVSAYAVNPGIPRTGDQIFQQDFDGVVQGRAGAQVLADAGAQRPAVIAIDNDFGSALVQGFTEHAPDAGLEIVSTDRNQFGEKNFDSAISRAIDKGADSVYLVQYVAEGKQFLEAWKRADVDLPLLSTEGIDSAGFIDSIGDLADGMQFTTNLNRDSDEQTTQAFLETFKQDNGFSADMVAASSHDAVMMLVEAMRAEGVDNVQAGLAGLKDFTGATGTVSGFTEDGQVIKPVQVQVFEGGSIVSAGVVDDTAIITP
jgi:branched-chain amino acid transport system substrate-binding protein